MPRWRDRGAVEFRKCGCAQGAESQFSCVSLRTLANLSTLKPLPIGALQRRAKVEVAGSNPVSRSGKRRFRPPETVAFSVLPPRCQDSQPAAWGWIRLGSEWQPPNSLEL